jgi:hypothetical protein
MMLEFMDEPVDVEVQVRSDGTVRPLAFVWHERRYEIQSWGRESDQERDGREVHCFLVQTAGPETWELCRDVELTRWTLARRWSTGQRLV